MTNNRIGLAVLLVALTLSVGGVVAGGTTIGNHMDALEERTGAQGTGRSWTPHSPAARSTDLPLVR